jgi:hypothetical protein
MRDTSGTREAEKVCESRDYDVTRTRYCESRLRDQRDREKTMEKKKRHDGDQTPKDPERRGDRDDDNPSEETAIVLLQPGEVLLVGRLVDERDDGLCDRRIALVPISLVLARHDLDLVGEHVDVLVHERAERHVLERSLDQDVAAKRMTPRAKRERGTSARKEMQEGAGRRGWKSKGETTDIMWYTSSFM